MSLQEGGAINYLRHELTTRLLTNIKYSRGSSCYHLKVSLPIIKTNVAFTLHIASLVKFRLFQHTHQMQQLTQSLFPDFT